jgi:hypothetical protein
MCGKGEGAVLRATLTLPAQSAGIERASEERERENEREGGREERERSLLRTSNDGFRCAGMCKERSK